MAETTHQLGIIAKTGSRHRGGDDFIFIPENEGSATFGCHSRLFAGDVAEVAPVGTFGFENIPEQTVVDGLELYLFPIGEKTRLELLKQIDIFRKLQSTKHLS